VQPPLGVVQILLPILPWVDLDLHT
jgi:hypothetical protein